LQIRTNIEGVHFGGTAAASGGGTLEAGSSWRCMDQDRSQLIAAMKRRIIWIAVAGVIGAGLAVIVLAATGPITFHLALAVALGVFFTFMLGGGLFTVSFFSSTSGYDSDVGGAHRDE
jgi:hypothetical protein